MNCGPEIAVQDDDEIADPRFQDPNERRRFIRKVYSILSLQLAVTAGMIAVFVYEESVKKYIFGQGLVLLYVALGIQIGVMIALSCCEKARRAFPLNIVLLMAYTLIQGMFLGIISVFLTRDEVFLSVGITTVVFLVLTLFAMQSKWDFTTMCVLPLILSVVLLCLGIACLIVKLKILNIIYCAVGIITFSLYIVIDTQMMMGGKNRRYTIAPEDYIYCCLALYIDVTTMLMYVMSLMRAARED